MDQPSWGSERRVVSPVYVVNSESDEEYQNYTDRSPKIFLAFQKPDANIVDDGGVPLEVTVPSESLMLGVKDGRMSDSDEFEEDMTPGGRYFLGAGEGNQASLQKCFNCGLPGHQSRECPSKSVSFLLMGSFHMRHSH